LALTKRSGLEASPCLPRTTTLSAAMTSADPPRDVLRPATLRRYYDAVWGGKPAPPSVYQGLSFEENWALWRFTYSTIGPRNAGLRSPDPAHKERASKLPADPSPQPDAAVALLLAGKAVLDAREALAKEARVIERVVVERCKTIVHAEAIHQRASVSQLSLTRLTDWQSEPLPVRHLERLVAIEAPSAVLEALLAIFAPRALDLVALDSEAVDLEALALPPGLQRLSVEAKRGVSGAAALRHLALEELALSGFTEDAIDLRAHSSLRVLRLQGQHPIAPFSALGALPKLEQATLTVRPEDKASVIEQAVRLPHVAFRFVFPMTIASPPRRATAPTKDASVLHRGVWIHQNDGGFEVSADLADLFGCGVDDGSLEDSLRPRFPEAVWRSEASELVVRARTIELLKAVVDAARAVGRAKAAARKAERAVPGKPASSAEQTSRSRGARSPRRR
jgi:hypothetical protein